MKSINYFGQQITVSDEVAEFLEQDRLRNAALLKQEKRHVNYVGFDIASVPDLFTDEPSNPTFERAFRNIRNLAMVQIYCPSGDLVLNSVVSSAQMFCDPERRPTIL